MLAEERARLHRLPQVPHTVCFGQTRKVSWQSTISVGGALYSVPSTLVDERVWARADGDELVVVHADAPDGPREVARHPLTTPGRPSIRDEHYPPRPAGALERRPSAGTLEEQAFLAIGPGAERWLIEAAAAGTIRLRRKVAEAVALAKLHGSEARSMRRSPPRRPPAASARATWRRSSRTTAARGDRVPRARERAGLAAALHALLGGLRRMTVKTPAAPPLPDELDRLLRRLRMPYVRSAAPEVIATADRPALGARRGPARPARRGGRRPRPGHDPDAPPRSPGCRPARPSTPGTERRHRSPSATQQALRTLEWIDRAESLCVCGPSGTGKSHLVEALGHLAIDRGKTVAWHTLESLAVMLRRHRADDSVDQARSAD